MIILFPPRATSPRWMARNGSAPWVTQQGRNFCIYLEEEKLECTELIRGRDSKFVESFDEILKDIDCRRIKLPIKSPNLNARCGSFIGNLKRECLNHFVILGEKHMNYLTSEFKKHYMTERPHQGLRERADHQIAGP